MSVHAVVVRALGCGWARFQPPVLLPMHPGFCSRPALVGPQWSAALVLLSLRPLEELCLPEGMVLLHVQPVLGSPEGQTPDSGQGLGVYSLKSALIPAPVGLPSIRKERQAPGSSSGPLCSVPRGSPRWEGVFGADSPEGGNYRWGV